MKEKSTQATLALAEPKYCIAQLTRKKYGELAIKKGLDELQNFCGIRRKQTVVEWLNIEAGEDTTISHFVINKVLSFFNLQTESQLFTDAHNNLLNSK